MGDLETIHFSEKQKPWLTSQWIASRTTFYFNWVHDSIPAITQKEPPRQQEYKFLYHNVIVLNREKKSNRKYFGSKINRDQKTPLGTIKTGQSHNIIQSKRLV